MNNWSAMLWWSQELILGVVLLALVWTFTPPDLISFTLLVNWVIAYVSRMQEGKRTADWYVLLLQRLVNMVNIEDNYSKRLSHKCVSYVSAVCMTAGFSYHCCWFWLNFPVTACCTAQLEGSRKLHGECCPQQPQLAGGLCILLTQPFTAAPHACACTALVSSAFS